MKTQLAIALLAATNGLAAQACRCDFAPMRSLGSDPSSAATAFIGELETLKGRRAIRVIRPWTQIGSANEDPGNGACALKLEPRTRYVFLSIHDAAFIAKRGLDFTVCDTLVKKLSDAGEWVENLAKRGTRGGIGQNPSWLFCTAASDCGVTRGVCDTVAAANKKYLAEIQAWNDELALRANCIPDNRPRPFSRLVCRRNLCEIEAAP